MEKHLMQNRLLKIILALLSWAIFLLIAIQLVNSLENYRNSDFFTFWLGGHMVWTGENLYSPEDWVNAHHQFEVTWIPNTRFVYPMPLAILFAPFGLLPLYYSYITWVFISEILILVSGYALFSLHRTSDRNRYVIPLLLGLLLFRPAWVILNSGQISGLLLFILTGVILLWEKDKWMKGSFLIPLIVLKPNIGVPILAVISFYFFIRKRYRELTGISASVVMLILLGMLISPNWIIDYWSIGSTKLSQTFGYSPTLWGLAGYLTDFNLSSTIILGMIFILITLFGVLFVIWLKRYVITPVWLISIAVTISLLVTPYIWSYDQLLMIIPILALTMELAANRYPILFSSTVFILIDLMSIPLLLVSIQIQQEVFYAILPLILLFNLLYFMSTVEKKSDTIFITRTIESSA